MLFKELPRVIQMRYKEIDVADCQAGTGKDDTFTVTLKNGHVDHWRYIPGRGWTRKI